MAALAARAAPGRPRARPRGAGLRRGAGRGASVRVSAVAEQQDAQDAEGGPEPGSWDTLKPMPCGDTLDKRVLQLWVPAMFNFMIIPLVGAVDTFWVGRMGDAAALAGQGAASQVYSSAFWVISFLPSLVSPLVAKAAAKGDRAELQRNVGEAVFVSAIIGVAGMVAMTHLPYAALAMVKAEPHIMLEGVPYIVIRALTFVPAIITTTAFAAFRGTMDVVTPLKITIGSQLLNVVLDPLLIFGFGAVKALGVAGAALATAASEVASFAAYMTLMLRRGLVTVDAMFRPPSWQSLKPLLIGGLAVQLRSLALNFTFLAVTRASLTLDASGTAAAAHAITMQLWQLGGIVLLSLSTIAAVLVPQVLNRAENGGPRAARRVADRMLVWGLLSGFVFGGVQVLGLPLLKVFTPLEHVSSAAVGPSCIAAVLQCVNGVVFVAEGLMQGHQAFGRLALNTAVGSVGLLTSLHFFGSTLEQVYFGYWVFNVIRLAGAFHHHFVSGPLADKNLPPPAVAAAHA